MVIENGQRLSRSVLWRLQRAFFEQQGIEAWRQGIVPHYITSNPFIAAAYARVVFGFLRDCQAANPSLDPKAPVYVVELGAGSGRFAYHFLKKFWPVYERSSLKEIRVVYVMTDFALQTIDFWRTHPRLQALVAAGRLDFARFDAEHPGNLTLMESGLTLSAERIRNPLALLANYFFDSIPQDCFTFRQGQLFESLVTLASSSPELDWSDPNALNEVELSYDHSPADVNYYNDPDLDRILQSYTQQLTDTSLLFPNVALQCIRYFRDLSHGRLLLLSGDKGYSHAEDLLDQEPPGLSLHGSFSLMINYHAIGEYFRNQGGQMLHTPHRHASLDVSACLLGQGSTAYLETAQAYEEAIVQHGPDDFFTLKKAVEKHFGVLTPEEILAYLRISAWDSNVFLGCFLVLLDHLATFSPLLREEFCRAAEQVWATYYPIGEDEDLAFYLGMLLYGMARYPEALGYFEQSVAIDGPNASTLYNMGICHYELHQWASALDCMVEATSLDPTFEPARTMRQRLEQEMHAASEKP